MTTKLVSNADTTVEGLTVPTTLFIDGTWRESSDRGHFEVLDPATGTAIATVANATPADALDALTSAHRAQLEWADFSPRQRAEILRNAYARIQDRRDDFATIMTAEMGRPYQESLAEVDYGAEFFRWFSEQSVNVHGDFGAAPGGAFDILTSKVPVGPSLLITPWNFPLAMGTRKIGAALAAGCTVLLKPAAQTPLTAALLIEVLVDAGVPAGVVNFIPTSDAATQSEILMADPRLRKISFTGSTGVGVQLLHQAAGNVMRSSMELGGNGPFIVLDDADVAAAVDGAMLAKFRNGGQSCVAANRFIVHRAVAADFTERLLKRTEALTVGNGRTPGVQVGPLIDERQRTRVRDLVRDAISAGARMLTGGQEVPGAGYYYQPTVLVDVPPTAKISTEEIFGPVAVVTTIDSEDEAIAMANDTPYGLAAFIYTNDVTRAFALAKRIDAGMVGINRGLVSEPGAPFGGMKASGLGREGGQTGIEEYLDTKYYALGRL